MQWRCWGFYVIREWANRGFHPMYTNQWHLAVERQFGNWVFKANYIGNSAIHLVTSTTINPATFLGLGPCALQVVNTAGQVVPQSFPTCSTTANQNQRRLLFMQNPLQGQYFGGIAQVLDSGTQEYEGLYLVVQKALSHGVTFNANYTWSHCIGDVFDQQPGLGGGSTPPYNRRAYRGNCAGIDQRQQFVLNLVATSPKFKRTWTRRLLSDWQIAPILQIHTGQWLTVTSGTDRALTTVSGQTVNQVLPNAYAANKGSANGNDTLNWLNPASFAIPALGTSGTTAYGIVRGPGMIQLNMALARTFPIHERVNFQIRAEAFNLPNLLNPGNPTVALNSALYGVINSDQSGNIGGSLQVNAGDYRIVQLAAKLVF